jgi:iron-sulfur cluster repair protein YtfE (RIC family)
MEAVMAIPPPSTSCSEHSDALAERLAVQGASLRVAVARWVPVTAYAADESDPLATRARALAEEALAHLDREESVLFPLVRARRYALAAPVVCALASDHDALTSACRALGDAIEDRSTAAHASASERASSWLADVRALGRAFAVHLSISERLFFLLLRLERHGVSR